MGILLSQQKNELKNTLFTVILCAGEGTRLREITLETPKPLIEINALNNKSILHHTIDLLIKLGINRIAVVKGYLGHKIDEFIDLLQQKIANLKEKLVVVDTLDQYKLGPLYSFLSITKNKNLFQSKYIYLIIPGDTIFQNDLINEIFSLLEKNFSIIQNYPLIFFRNIKGNFFKQLNKSKEISLAEIMKVNSQKFLKRIKSVKLSNISDSEYFNQIIPIFLFPFNFIQEIIKTEKGISAKTIRETVNHIIKEGNKMLAIEIDSKYNFYDIDYKSDIAELDNKKKVGK